MAEHTINNLLLFLKGLGTVARFSVVFYKGDNFCDALFAFLNSKPHSERGLL